MFRSLVGRHRDRTLLVVMVLLSCVLLALDEGQQAGVARALGTSLYAPVQALVRGAEETLLLRRENRQLRRLVATLNMERQRLLQAREDAAQLRRLAGFAKERFPELLPCEVVGYSTDPFQSALQLGCGARDSLRAGMPVAAYSGLVGRVEEVSPERSLLQTLASPELAVSVRDQRSDVVGILRWVRGSQFTMDRVDAVEDVLVGDPVVTSGLGDYPRGIPVGVVTRVGVSLDGLFKVVDVRTHVDFAGLRDVFIVTGRLSWQENSLYTPEDRVLLGRAEDGDSGDAHVRIPSTGGR